MAIQACTNCDGTGKVALGGYTAECPSCEGTGKKWDPGREFEYEMGPFTLNAFAAASGIANQNAAGLAVTGPTAEGVSCQITNKPFRVMFVMAKSTFPFSIQLADGGSGSGRYFSPQQTQVHSLNMFGDSRHPMPWPTPYVFQRQINITANVTDLAGGVGFCGVTNGSAAVTWVSGALFNTFAAPGPPFPGVPIWSGQQINIGGVLYQISGAAGSGVTSQTTLTLATTYQGATNANIAYAVSNSIRIAFKGQELSQ